jgi:hypothetical protein
VRDKVDYDCYTITSRCTLAVLRTIHTALQSSNYNLKREVFEKVDNEIHLITMPWKLES